MSDRMRTKTEMVKELINDLDIEWDEVKSFKLNWETHELGGATTGGYFTDIFPNVEIIFK